MKEEQLRVISLVAI